MDSILVVIIIFLAMFGFFVATTVLLHKFIKKNSVYFHIINPDMSESRKRFKEVKTKQVNIDGSIYNFDEDCCTRTLLYKHIYFIRNVPYPIHFNNDTKKALLDIKIKAEDIGTFAQSNLIQKLFSENTMEKLIVILLIGCMIGIIATIVLTASGGNSAVELATGGNNTAIIRNACELAIKGV